MTEITTALHPSTPQLLKATALALAAAGAILLTTVLPAEYGIDPTGVGKALGLTALHTPAGENTAVAASAQAVTAPATDLTASVIQQPTPFQNGEMTLTLQANEGAEIKAQMHAGEAFVFSWVSEGPVNFDMHGEKPNDGDNFTSYWKDREKSEGHGSFTAPFDGSQGWYWKNKGNAAVTITLKVSGYFQKLYRPG
ncbi:MAG: hypothetical protein V4650_12700 [Pseudomonadota bacterium]